MIDDAQGSHVLVTRAYRRAMAMSKRLCNDCSLTYEMTEPGCPGCGADIHHASQQVIRPERLSTPGTAARPTATPDESNTMAIAGIVCGCVAFLILPIVFGPAGVIFSAVALGRKEPRAGLALFVSLAGLVVGLLLGRTFAS